MILFLHNPVRATRSPLASGCGVTLYIEVSVCVVSEPVSGSQCPAISFHLILFLRYCKGCDVYRKLWVFCGGSSFDTGFLSMIPL